MCGLSNHSTKNFWETIVGLSDTTICYPLIDLFLIIEYNKLLINQFYKNK